MKKGIKRNVVKDKSRKAKPIYPKRGRKQSEIRYQKPEVR